ncbi:uncharacterized protein LOC117320002 [Pecten maximus]|uniref:uncharacterized protein LOC117320002 n=1 Tax=Pecten maximus TaxID=6579 RepID=UPI0014580C63|nr:uncharacterized protein LOC117320002 [Pecten maximus]
MASNLGRSIIKAQDPVRLKGHPKCQVHKQNDVLLLCRDCKMLICITCSISSHKEHIDSFQELTNIKTEQNQIIQDFLDETDNVKIPKLNQEILSSRIKISSRKPMYDKLRKNIIDNNNECKLEMDKITEEYITLCDKMEVADTDLIQTHITDLERRLDTLKELSSEYKQTLQTGTGVLKYDSVSEIRELDSDIPPTPNIDMAEFTPGIDRQSHLKQALGKLKIPADPLRYTLPDSPTVMAQFSYTDYISSICPTSDGRAWLCDRDTDTVNLINNKGQVIHTIKHNSNIDNISLNPTTGRLWFSCRDERSICEVSFFTFLSLFTPATRFTIEDYPYSLCVTREGRVVVGTGGEQGYKVMIYTVDGQVLHTHIVEGSGTGYVLSISQCSVTGNIAVVSGKHISGEYTPDNYRRHISVYNPTLRPLVHYRGEGIEARGEGMQVQKSVTPDKFGPITVVYDSKGNIVIADRTRNTIELISGAGKYIKTLHTNKGWQWVVGIQKGDVLWSELELDTGELGLKLLKYYSD